MLFRPLELIWNGYQKGFSFFSFAFPDDSYYSLLAVIRIEEGEGWWFSIAFNGFYYGIVDEFEIELEEDDDDQDS